MHFTEIIAMITVQLTHFFNFRVQEQFGFVLCFYKGFNIGLFLTFDYDNIELRCFVSWTRTFHLISNFHDFPISVGLKWYFVPKIVLTYCEKKLFYWSKKLLKFDAVDQEFAKILRSLEQFSFKQWKVRTIFGNRMLFQLRTIKIQIGI